MEATGQDSHLDKLAKRGLRFDRTLPVSAVQSFPFVDVDRPETAHDGRFGQSRLVWGRTPRFHQSAAYFKNHGYATVQSGKIFHAGIDDTESWTEGGKAVLSVPERRRPSQGGIGVKCSAKLASNAR